MGISKGYWRKGITWKLHILHFRKKPKYGAEIVKHLPDLYVLGNLILWIHFLLPLLDNFAWQSNLHDSLNSILKLDRRVLKPWENLMWDLGLSFSVSRTQDFKKTIYFSKKDKPITIGMKEIRTDHQHFYACISSNTVLCVSLLFKKKITNELMINFSQSHLCIF